MIIQARICPACGAPDVFVKDSWAGGPISYYEPGCANGGCSPKNFPTNVSFFPEAPVPVQESPF